MGAGFTELAIAADLNSDRTDAATIVEALSAGDRDKQLNSWHESHRLRN